ncbi:hypothetical protein GCM10025867_47100 (plasmid) [Frondihabitans sucicola]|uniref:DUF1273 family protein n=1 Tax=Frondihabitans sucicola TaxID=1268041 RepID=A0ABM8GVG6_9MICO|nr:hypothetical protein [Frondihabitans sucicola]BDZ52469.1 hypothetical protein GCM10025867_47100 [Frondihabitans sucicola]
MSPETSVMITGHRNLPGESWSWVAQEMDRCLGKLHALRGELAAIQGLALGADMLFGETALRLGFPVDSYVPFPGQASKWPAHEQRRRDALMAASRKIVHVVAEPITERHLVVRALHARNDAMIRDSQIVIAVLDERTSGGTHGAVKKALARDREVLRINPTEHTTAWIRSIR